MKKYRVRSISEYQWAVEKRFLLQEKIYYTSKEEAIECANMKIIQDKEKKEFKPSIIYL